MICCFKRHSTFTGGALSRQSAEMVPKIGPEIAKEPAT